MNIKLESWTYVKKKFVAPGEDLKQIFTLKIREFSNLMLKIIPNFLTNTFFERKKSPFKPMNLKRKFFTKKKFLRKK